MLFCVVVDRGAVCRFLFESFVSRAGVCRNQSNQAVCRTRRVERGAADGVRLPLETATAKCKYVCTIVCCLLVPQKPSRAKPLARGVLRLVVVVRCRSLSLFTLRGTRLTGGPLSLAASLHVVVVSPGVAATDCCY